MASSSIQSATGSIASATSVTVTFGAAPAIGNLIVVLITQLYGVNPSRAISSVQDGVSAAYSLGKKAGAAGDSSTTDIYYRVATTTNAAITITLAAAASVSAAVVEYPSTYSTFDSGAGASSANVGNGASPQTATPGSASQGSTSLYINGVGHNQAYTTFSLPTNFNQVVNVDNGIAVPIFLCDQIVSGAQNPASTLTGTTTFWSDVLVTFTGGAVFMPRQGLRINQAINRARTY